MNLRLLENIREKLALRQASLTDWLFNTPAAERALELGNTDEAAVQAHLQTLDGAIAAAEDGRLGLCEVCHERVEEALLELDYTACVCIEHLNTDEQRMLEFELEMAAGVQRSLLPQSPPDFPELQIAAFSRPAQILGGDYFDFMNFAPSAAESEATSPGGPVYGLVIGDVAGHGISAGLHMAAMQSVVRTVAPLQSSPGEVLAQLHRLLVHNTTFATFITAFLAAYHPQRRQLTYSNAGHSPPLLLRAAARSATAAGLPLETSGDHPGAATNLYHQSSAYHEWLAPTAPAVGLVEEAHFGLAAVQLEPEDTLILYTDGLTESTNAQAEQFGPLRLAQAAWEARRRPVTELAQAIRREAEAFSGEQALPDDVTLVVCRVAS